MSDVRDPVLRELLDERTGTLAPRPDALDRVHATARRRRRRRRVAGGATALVATMVALTFAGGVLREPATPGTGRGVAAINPAAQSNGPESVRDSIGISGPTKGAPGVTVAKSPAPDNNHASLATVQIDTGVMRPLPPNAASATVSPQETTVAMVTKDDRVVVESTVSSNRHSLGRQRPGATISWDPGGTALFAFVDRHWIRVPAPDSTGRVITQTQVRVLSVPRLPGGPSFLSVSPAMDYVVLFGVADPQTAGNDERVSSHAGTPHLYLGRYDQGRVSEVHRLHLPANARQGPMGWLGDNAFVIGTGSGSAWIVRVNRTHLAVVPALPDGCSLAAAPAPCRSLGPRLLGTNAGGALLYWRVSGHPASAAAGHHVVAFFSTWLDGSHAKPLTGPAGTYGPALAAR
jgi:hypothetical protein